MTEETQQEIQNEGVQEGKSGGGCRRILKLGCLGLLGLLAAGVAAGLLLGLGGNEIEQRYSGAPDLAASQELEEAFLDLGIQGVSALVIPARGPQGAVAVITMDESKGFTGFRGAGFDQVMDSLNRALVANSLDLDYISLVYAGPDGEIQFSMATDQETVSAYAAGQITRAEMMGNVEIDISNFLDALDYSTEFTN